MTSYPAHLVVEDIANDINVSMFTVRRWLQERKIIGLKSASRWVVSANEYIKFLLKHEHYKEKSKYYIGYVDFMRRYRLVQKNKKES